MKNYAEYSEKDKVQNRVKRLLKNPAAYRFSSRKRLQLLKLLDKADREKVELLYHLPLKSLSEYARTRSKARLERKNNKA